ncbi:MAG: heat-inducible transcription repressor HrcA [Candidatus Hydrogenedens sp.]|nr:heat-inducible transcription repressor HrcA [Candidatus Hydrogenedens sp.]
MEAAVESAKDLSERERTILCAVVNCYVTTAEPVGSRSVVKQFGLDWSPATVRNTMADLEDLGFLKQVHTSSGRVPTEAGFKYYVKYLMQVQELTLRERSQIQDELNRKLNDTDDVLRQTTQLLALLTHQAGIAEAPAEASVRVQRIEAVRLTDTRMAVLLVDNYGRVRSTSVEVGESVSGDQLQRLNNFMNDNLSGVEVAGMADGVRQRLKDYFDEQRLLAQRALEVLDVLPQQKTKQLFVEGAMQLFDQPEFADMSRAREVFGLIERHDPIAAMLREGLQSSAGRQRVFIGEEGTALEGLSVVASPYTVNGRPVGMVGILGPRRMPYSRLTSVVDYTAGMVSRILERFAR